MDGVKISVGGEGGGKPAKKRGRPKKTVVKKTVAKKTIAETKAVPKTTSTTAKKSVKKGGFLSTLIAVVITAVVVGGAIYAWQNKSTEASVTSVRQEARKVRIDFEQRVEQLKNKLTGVETENQKLKNTTAELEERVKLLDGAKKDFVNEELGIDFEYPALFGEVTLTMTDGASGKKYLGSFTKNDKLTFGGVGVDYLPVASSTKVEFLETSGYMEEKDKYYFQTIAQTESSDVEIVPSQIIDAGNTKVFLIDQKSFVIDEDKDGATVEIGENIGAMLNLQSDAYKGMSFLNQDLAILPLESYIKMLSSIEIK